MADQNLGDDELLFEGLRVIDAGTWIAAPVATTMLADLGADVIKIEQPEVGDAYRNLSMAPATPTAPNNVNYAWAMDARNKRSLTLNLKAANGIDILKRLVSACDVYVTNHPQNMRRSLGLTYDDLKPLNPRMIYASFTAYGEDGPERDREGFDLVAYWARSGLMDLVRSPGAAPAQSLPGMGDHPSAVTMYANIVTALLRRDRTGKGALVHSSLLANGLWSASCIAQAAFAGADLSDYRSPERQHYTRALYQTADHRWLQFTMLRTADDFDRFLLALDRVEWLADPRFATVESRFENGSALTEVVQEVLASAPAEHWMSVFAEHGVPASLVGRMKDLPDDIQIEVNNMTSTPVEPIGMDRVIRDPINVEGVARVGPRKAPDIGEHTDEVLTELGFTPEEVQRLRAEGAV